MAAYKFFDYLIAEYGHLLFIAFAHASVVLVVGLRIYFTLHPPEPRPFSIIIIPPTPPRRPDPVPPPIGSSFDC